MNCFFLAANCSGKDESGTQESRKAIAAIERKAAQVAASDRARGASFDRGKALSRLRKLKETRSPLRTQNGRQLSAVPTICCL